MSKRGAGVTGIYATEKQKASQCAVVFAIQHVEGYGLRERHSDGDILHTSNAAVSVL